jgi:5-methyltetrahydropteroyltriglutamate--homocysteine methyltransferase
MALTTVVGSYPKIPEGRPAKLRTALARLDRGDITPEELARVEDEVTLEVMDEQAAAGIELITDGQVRWLDEVTYIAGRLDGIGLGGLTRFFDTNTYFRRPIVEGGIEYRADIVVSDYRFAAAGGHLVKPVLTGPYTLARLSNDAYYGDFERLLLAYSDALNSEALALQALQPPLIQFNEPAITRHPEDVELAARAWWRLLQDLKVETAVYFYFGPPGDALGQAIEAGFTTIGVDATIDGVLESVARGARPGKLAAGVVDARTTRLEPPALVEARIRAAMRIAGPDDLYLNPNMGLEFLPREQAKAKLRRLAEVARRIEGVRV